MRYTLTGDSVCFYPNFDIAMIHGGESASSIDPAEAVLDAVKTYVRMNRQKLAADGEFLALLLPERFGSDVRDLQRHVIEKLSAENQDLRREREALMGMYDRSTRIGKNVRRAILEIVSAVSFAETITVALAAAPRFGADLCAFCSERPAADPADETWLHRVAAGTADALVGDGMGAILGGGGELLFGAEGAGCKSIAAFRLKFPNGAPPLLYVMGAFAEGKFEGRQVESDLRFFVQVLERALRMKPDGKWLVPPKA
jgi:hypothetical protein